MRLCLLVAKFVLCGLNLKKKIIFGFSFLLGRQRRRGQEGGGEKEGVCEKSQQFRHVTVKTTS